jgi:hypothetical protein
MGKILDFMYLGFFFSFSSKLTRDDINIEKSL